MPVSKYVYTTHDFLSWTADVFYSYIVYIYRLLIVFPGTIGFFGCFWFVTKIYSVVKVD